VYNKNQTQNYDPEKHPVHSLTCIIIFCKLYSKTEITIKTLNSIRSVIENGH